MAANEYYHQATTTNPPGRYNPDPPSYDQVNPAPGAYQQQSYNPQAGNVARPYPGDPYSQSSLASDNNGVAYGGRLNQNDQYAENIPLKTNNNAPPFPNNGPPPSWMQQQTRYSPSMEGGQMNPTIIPGRRRKQAFFWRSGKKIPWVTYLMTTIQIAVFIAELVRNAQLTGTPIEIHPSFNPMIGPSPYVQIYMGSRFVPCMKNINGVQNANETVYWNCPNTTTSDSSAASNHCTLSELCGFDGVPNPHPGGSLSDRPEPNQWFRFIIPMFIHAGFIHIGFNLLTQLTVGSAMERLIGWWRYAIVYLASGIFGFVMGGNYAAQGISSCGCSGCLFGILALELLDLLYTWKQRPSPWVELVIMLVGVAVSFFLGLLPGLDNFSHIGGFLMGLALGLCLMRSPSSLQERIGLAGNPYVAMSGGAGPGASDDDNNSTNNNGNNNNNNNRNANKATRPATSITDFLKGRRAPEGPSSLLDVFRGRKPLWWAWWLVRIGSLVAILIGFILLIVDFYKYASSTCSWCYRLSCLPIKNWCDEGNLELTQTS